MSNSQDSWDNNLTEIEEQEGNDVTRSTRVESERLAGGEEVDDESTENSEDEDDNDANEKEGDDGTKSRKRKRTEGNITKVSISPYWIHFDKFYCDVDNVQKAKCNYCGRIIRADPSKHGTGSLQKHFKACKKKPCDGTGPPCDGTDPQLVSWKFDQNKVREVVRYMILVDELPLRTVDKLGFRYLMSIACPMFKMPSRRAVTRDIYEFYCKEKKKLKFLLKRHSGRISITTDTWTSIQRINYMCLTAHFIDDNWKLQKRILNFCPISGHKSEDIGIGIEKCLLDWGLDKIFTITVDNASSNGGAVTYLKNKFDNLGTNLLGGKYVHVRYIAHIVNLIVQDGLKNKEEHDAITRIRGAIRYIRNSPARYKKFIERAGREKLDTNKLLCLDVPTRWNSTHLMLESALCLRRAFDAYVYVDSDYRIELSKPPYNGIPGNYDSGRARLLVKFLEHFYKLTLSISGSLMVTSNNVFHEISGVEWLLKEWAGSEDFELGMMSIRMKEKYDKYWGSSEKMNTILYIAVVLDPRHKLDFLEFSFDRLYDNASKSKSMKTKVKNDLLELFDTYKKMYGAPESPAVDISSSSSLGTSEFSASTVMNDQYHKFKMGVRKEHVKTELDRYLCEDYDSGVEMNVLEWWKLSSHRFSVLFKIARDVFVVPVSTVASESTFSTGGRVLDAFRSSLSTKIVQALICSQNWLRSESTPIGTEEDLGELEALEKEFTTLGVENTIVDV